MSEKRLLRVSNLRVEIENEIILDGIDFVVYSGEVVALTGSNGAGKTMTLRAIVGLEESTEGKILFDDIDVTSCSTHKRVKAGMAFCPSEQALFPQMSVKENLEMGCFLAPELYQEGLYRVLELFPRLRSKLDQKAGLLSGGEQKMCAISKSLMIDPKMFLLDEFSAGLSQTLSLEVARRIGRINERGATVLLVEQNLSLVPELAHRDYVMQRGEIVSRNVFSP